MAKVKIEFNTGNAAFEGDGWNYEVYTVLKELADLAWEGQLAERSIRDSNGNKIGRYAEVEE